VITAGNCALTMLWSNACPTKIIRWSFKLDRHRVSLPKIRRVSLTPSSPTSRVRFVTSAKQETLKVESEAPPLLPPELQDSLARAQALAPIPHTSHDGKIRVTWSPYLDGRTLVLHASVELVVKSGSKDIILGCPVVDEEDGQPQKDYKLSGIYERHADSYTQTKEVSADLSVGASQSGASAAATAGVRYATSRVIRNLELTQIHPPNADSGPYVQLSLKSGDFGRKEVIRTDFVVTYTLTRQADDPQRLRLNSVIQRKRSGGAYGKLTNSIAGKLEPSLLTSCFAFSTTTSTRAIIGAVVGYPKSGKTSFLGVLFRKLNGCDAFGPGVTTTCTSKHQFRNVPLSGLKGTWNFDFMDTRGYYFTVNAGGDGVAACATLLRRFIAGVPLGTKFTKSVNPASLHLDTSNAATHMIVAANARELYTLLKSWWFGTSGSTNSKGLDDLKSLYKETVQILAEERHQGKFEEAQKRVGIVITHLDQVGDARKQKDSESAIRSFFEGLVTPEFLVFGGKKCTWKLDVLQAHEQKVLDIFVEAKSQNQDFLTYVTERQANNKLEAFFPHIDPSKCTNDECTKELHPHPFLQPTKEAYMGLLKSLVMH
jgi:hypothetical protein